MKTRLTTAVVIVTNVLGNFSLSWGMKHRGLEALLSPWVLLGVCLLIVWLLSRMALLSWADLSYVLPVTSVGYVLAAVVGYIFLHEHVSPARWAGTLLIVAGVALVGLTAPRTTPRGPR